MKHLRDADGLVIATRFRDLPENQMRELDRYLLRGGPVVGMRTATHAFNISKGKKYSHYGNGYQGELDFWRGGFGRAILGEKWISHHGAHRQQSTRGVIAGSEKKHPIVRGIKTGDIWGPTDVYGVRLPLPGDSRTLVFGQVLSGMQPADLPVEGAKNNPQMPIAWTKSYQLPAGERGRVFTTTMGSSNDLMSDGLRRLIVQDIYWAVGLEESIPANGLRADIVEPYNPSDFGFQSDEYWLNKNIKPADFLSP
ncbi:MAG: ThuA domain-containing protein [Pirellulales bacterium]|nr:ThuA domain-containing protein [Pirellulales bacterium]